MDNLSYRKDFRVCELLAQLIIRPPRNGALQFKTEDSLNEDLFQVSGVESPSEEKPSDSLSTYSFSDNGIRLLHKRNYSRKRRDKRFQNQKQETLKRRKDF